MLVNKIAQSGLIVLDLEEYYPKDTVMGLDISQFLFRNLILKEKEFRQALSEYDWTTFQNCDVALHCSTEAIIPQWAFMLMATYLQGNCRHYEFATPEILTEQGLINRLNEINIEQYRDERVIIKGCGRFGQSSKAYVEITRRLLPVVKNLMFGEACSTVPIYKKK